MSRTRNTNVRTEPQDPAALVRAPSSKLQACEVTSFKLDRSSSLGYHRINGKVQQRSRFVGPSHITNRRHAHLVRSSTRAARSTLESKPIKDLMKAVASPGDREQLKQSTSEQRLKHRGPTSTVNGQASKALVQ